LDTTVLKAIAWLGYSRARYYLTLQLVLQSLCVLSYLWYGRFIRKASKVESGDLFHLSFLDGAWAHLTAFSVVACTWMLRAMVLLSELRGNWRWGLQFFSFGKIIKCLWQLLESLVILSMFPASLLPFISEAVIRNDTTRALMRLALAFFQAMCWIQVLHLLCGLETCNIGVRILAIYKTFDEIWSFLLVMVFFLGSALTVSYIITDTPISLLILEIYNLGFAGEYNQDAFMDDDEIDKLSPSGIWALRFFVYSLFGIVIMVSLNNIFIGILSQTYEKQRNLAAQLLVRERARVALEWSYLEPWLLPFKGAVRNDQFLWICAAEAEDDDDDSSTRKMLQQTNHKLVDLEEKVLKNSSMIKDFARKAADAKDVSSRRNSVAFADDRRSLLGGQRSSVSLMSDQL